jgi:hypothetical protein
LAFSRPTSTGDFSPPDQTFTLLPVIQPTQLRYGQRLPTKLDTQSDPCVSSTHHMFPGRNAKPPDRNYQEGYGKPRRKTRAGQRLPNSHIPKDGRQDRQEGPDDISGKWSPATSRGCVSPKKRILKAGESNRRTAYTGKAIRRPTVRL